MIRIFQIALFLSIFTGFSRTVSAGTATDSFICPGAKPAKSGMTCCLPDSCAKQEIWVAKFQSEIAGIREKILDNTLGIRTPNCFWAALRISGFSQPMRVSSFNEWQLDKALSSEYFELSGKERLEIGDILVFVQRGHERQPIFSGNKLVGEEWPLRDHAVHAAVYVGGDIIFQKEDMYSATFSFSTIDKAFRAYESEIDKKDRYFRFKDYLIKSYRRRSTL